MPHLTGLVLAAGAGTRIGQPKALLHTADGTPWLSLATTLLRDAGCERVLVVLGARAAEARMLLEPGAERVIAEDWADGMSASLRAGLAAATGDAVLLTLVDLPGMPVSVPRRVLEGDAREGGAGADGVRDAGAGALGGSALGGGALGGSAAGVTGDVLRQAVFEGRPGHPVLIGRDHWGPLAATLMGDQGGRRYLVSHGVDEVECSDLWNGVDVDA